MRVIRMVGVCMIAGLALGVVGVSAAQAEQFEFGKCQKAVKVGREYQGHFTDKNCTEEVSGGGKYEFVPLPEGSAVAQTGKGKGVTLSIPSVGESMTCSKSSMHDTLTGPKEGEGTVTFTGCTASQVGTCSTGSTGGEVAMKVKIKLDYTPPKEVTIEIVFGKNATEAARIKCGTLELGLWGSTDGFETGNVDVMSTKSLDTWGGEGGVSSLFVEAGAGGPQLPAQMSAAISLKNEKLEVKTHV